MKSRLSQFLVIMFALVAFMPVLAVDYLLDNYIREKESTRILGEIVSLNNEAQQAVYGGLRAVEQVLNDSPSLCTQTFVTNVQKQLQTSVYLRQILVENRDGVQYCDGYGGAVSYSVLSRQLTIPGSVEAISVVRFEGETVPGLKISQLVGRNRIVSAFVHLSPRLLNGLPAELAEAELLRFELTDGSEIVTFGDDATLLEHDGDHLIHMHAIADALPLMAEVAVPFEAVRSGYANLDIGVTLISALLSGVFLILTFNYVRRARLPSFDLERAIEKGELQPYYQPVMNIRTGQIAGCEVLIRWEKPNGEIISPGMFIDYAESSGLAIPMTIKLMEQVREDLSQLYTEIDTIKTAINLFEGHFRDASIVEDVQAIFENSPIPYRQLVFEITERRPLNDLAATNSVIGGLHALGCRLAMDDAGTGHSNLEYIQTLGLDIIKIDKVFVDMIRDDGSGVPVLDGLINMALDMETGIVAEGVETEEQAVYLRARGVVEAQGYLFAPALPCDAYVSLVRALNDMPGEHEEIAGSTTPELLDLDAFDEEPEADTANEAA